MRKLQPIVFYAITRKHTKSKRAPPKVSKLVPFLLSKQKFQWSRAFKECVLHVFMTKVKVFEKKISGSWYPMKGLARRNTHVKYESPSTYQSKVITKKDKLH